VLDALPDATAVLDGSGAIVAVNRAWQMFSVDNGGRPESTGVGVDYLDICTRAAADGCKDAELASAGLRAVLDGASVDTELEYPCPSPAANRWFLLRITALAGPEPGAVASHINITRRKLAEETTAHEAAHDPLTGLANRTRFNAALSAALRPRSALPGGSFVGVLYLDLDRFKQVNDTLGHHMGDEVLVVTAHRLRQVLRPQDTVARLGGDEFAVCAPHVTLAELATLAAKVDDALQAPHLLQGQRVRVPASVGIHLCSPGDEVDVVLQQADRDMFASKRARAAGTQRALIQSVP
jgi:diguanylate cyclase (GGDEF)-like protein